uniref:Sodium ion-translocating decarboxylase, beta subunit n=1 Tax=uncultured organism TaxID=155900 RepID=M1QB09_9ZZZZ|nr:sodium ion-translocating decarboxylase, beta subunit [uncultured organism]
MPVNIVEGLMSIWMESGLMGLSWKNLVMFAIGSLLIYLGIKYEMEPLLLVPIGLGAILTNIPNTGIAAQGEIGNVLYLFEHYLIRPEIVPTLIFLGVGAMTDFGPLLSDPKTFLLGAAAQVGIFATLIGALALGFSAAEAASIGIIGGADGPTTIYTTSTLAPHILGATSVAAYSYMAMVPLIIPPVVKLLTTKKERQIKMKQTGNVSKRVKMIFPVVAFIVAGLLVPKSIPLIGMVMVGNLFKESGVTDRLAKGASEELMNIVTIILGLTVGSTMTGSSFIRVETLMILVLGVAAFAVAVGSGVLLAKLMNLISSEKINPMIGAAGCSAVPMAARVVQDLGKKEDPHNNLLMHAMGPNVAGVLGSATAAGILITLVQGL